MTKKILLPFLMGCSMLLACQSKKENTEKKEDVKAQTETPAEDIKSKSEKKVKPKAPPKAPASTQVKLMGKWQSTEDASNFVVFEPNNTDNPTISGFMKEGGERLSRIFQKSRRFDL